MDRTPEEIRNAIFKKLDVIHSQYEFWVDYAEKLEKENKELHRLLDLRDDDYFRFCETGRMPDEEDTADAE